MASSGQDSARTTGASTPVSAVPTLPPRASSATGWRDGLTIQPSAMPFPSAEP